MTSMEDTVALNKIWLIVTFAEDVYDAGHQVVSFFGGLIIQPG